jgi:hypothetical protein
MSQTISGSPPYNAPYFYAQAMPGMKGDSMEDNVETFACGAVAIGFGLIASRTAANSIIIAPGGTTNFVGISLHDHLIASRGGYTQYDAVSTLTRGRAWCVVGGATTGLLDGAPVYVLANGQVSAISTGNTLLLHSIFRTASASVFDLLGGTAVNVALVEMHYPLAA